MEKDGEEFRFKLLTNTESSVRRQVAESIVSNLREIGVIAEIRLMEFNLMSETLKRHDFEGYVGAWSIATKIDPKPTFHSVSVNDRYNYVNYTNPRVDELIEKGRVMNISDPKIKQEALDLWYEFQDILHEDQPYTMLFEPRALVCINKRFTNVRVTSLRWNQNLDSWWIVE